MPQKKDKDYPLAEKKLEDQLAITKNFKGKTLVIPGNHDWYSGVEGLNTQEGFVKKYFDDKKAFLPKSGCPIDDISLSKDINRTGYYRKRNLAIKRVQMRFCRGKTGMGSTADNRVV